MKALHNHQREYEIGMAVSGQPHGYHSRVKLDQANARMLGRIARLTVIKLVKPPLFPVTSGIFLMVYFMLVGRWAGHILPNSASGFAGAFAFLQGLFVGGNASTLSGGIVSLKGASHFASSMLEFMEYWR